MLAILHYIGRGVCALESSSYWQTLVLVLYNIIVVEYIIEFQHLRKTVVTLPFLTLTIRKLQPILYMLVKVRFL